MVRLPLLITSECPSFHPARRSPHHATWQPASVDGQYSGLDQSLDWPDLHSSGTARDFHPTSLPSPAYRVLKERLKGTIALIRCMIPYGALGNNIILSMLVKSHDFGCNSLGSTASHATSTKAIKATEAAITTPSATPK